MVLPELRGVQGLASQGPGAPLVRLILRMVLFWVLALLGLALFGAGIVLLIVALVRHFGEVLALMCSRG